jgi:RNA polymerase sigma-70 factor (ECF subfamily)
MRLEGKNLPTRGSEPDPHGRREFDEAFCALLPRLYRRALTLTGKRQAAEDALHDTYLKLARHPDRMVRHPEPYAYAFATVLSVLRDGWRRRSREVLFDDVADVRSAYPAPLNGTGGWDGGVGVREAEWETLRLLAALTPRQAAIVLLVDVDGYTLDQVAALIGRHRGTVARIRDRALKKLRGVVQATAMTAVGGDR